MRENTHRQKIIQLADNIIEARPSYSDEDISKELMLIGDVDLLKKFVFKQLKRHFSGIESQAFIEIVEFCGWQYFEQELEEYLTPQWGAIEWLSSLLNVESLSIEGKTIIKKWFCELWKPSLEYCLTKDQISKVLSVVALLKLEAIADEVSVFLFLQKSPDFLTDIYAAAVMNALNNLNGLDYDCAIMDKMIDQVCQRIQADFPAPPSKPVDFARKGRLQCSCQFCTQINEFLPDPEQSKMSFNKTLKRNLTHIESEIRKNRVDLSFRVTKSPPKFDGVCKKTQETYDRSLVLFNTAQKMLNNLNGKR